MVVIMLFMGPEIFYIEVAFRRVVDDSIPVKDKVKIGANFEGVLGAHVPMNTGGVILVKLGQ